MNYMTKREYHQLALRMPDSARKWCGHQTTPSFFWGISCGWVYNLRTKNDLSDLSQKLSRFTNNKSTNDDHVLVPPFLAMNWGEKPYTAPCWTHKLMWFDRLTKLFDRLIGLWAATSSEGTIWTCPRNGVYLYSWLDFVAQFHSNFDFHAGMIITWIKDWANAFGVVMHIRPSSTTPWSNSERLGLDIRALHGTLDDGLTTQNDTSQLSKSERSSTPSML